MPLEATQHTPEGAKAFAEFFIKTIDWGYATTSSAYMRHYFRTSCVGCRSTAIALDRARAKQRHFIGDRFAIRSSSMVSRTTTRTAHVLVTFDVNSSEVVDVAGKFVDGGPALKDFREQVDLSWSSNRWLISEFTSQP